MATADRPVRLIIDGRGHNVLDSHGHPTKAMRVSYDTGQGTHGTVLVLTDSPDVLVAEVELPREWADGDAVAGSGSAVLHRVGGKWHQVTEHGVCTAYDADVDAEVLAGTYRVLRYQAGGDA